jgi:uncharacterized protein YkwD
MLSWMSGGFVLLIILPGLLLNLINITQAKAAMKMAQVTETLTYQMPQQNRVMEQLRPIALELVNRDRAAAGLAPLVEDPLLSSAAELHAIDMANHGYFDHHNANGQGPKERFAALGGSGGVGENIIYTPYGQSEQRSVQLLEHFQSKWMQSPRHRKNLLDSRYTYFGYGIAISPDGKRIYAVQKFAP